MKYELDVFYDVRVNNKFVGSNVLDILQSYGYLGTKRFGYPWTMGWNVLDIPEVDDLECFGYLGTKCLLHKTGNG